MPESLFAITATTAHDGSKHLHLHGELDLAHIDALTQAATDLHDAERVIVELAELTFVDSSGITALLAAAHLCRERGQSFTITGAHGAVARVLQICGVDSLLAEPGQPAGPS